MKKNIIVIFFGLLCFSFGCREKDLDMTLVEKTVYDGATIQAITAEDAWDVTVVQDDQTFVELAYSAFLEDYLRVVVNDGELKIGFNRYLNLPSNTEMYATVHTPSMQQLHCSEAVQAALEGSFSGHPLTITLSEGTTCRGGHLTGNVDLKLDQASTMVGFTADGATCTVDLDEASVLKGTLEINESLLVRLNDASWMTTYGGAASQVSAEVHEASSLNMLETEVGAMHITLTAASEASVFVTGTLEGSVTEASNLTYKGTPVLNVDTDESSTVYPL